MAYAAPYGTMSPPNAYPVSSSSGPAYPQQQAMHASPHELPPPARPGTLPVGTRIMIGQYKVTIERFLSEGGFAHVYVARSSAPIDIGGTSQTQHVLKRLAVPDKQQLQEVRKEVENMKRVSGHPHIVNFIEASASQMPGGSGYEIFILMEYVPGGGIIDMMNTRLQNRLTESEILKIFSDTVEAVAHMHHLNPPMMHRDLKVENILMASPSNYKLCDFGSATVPLPKAPSTMAEIQALEQDLNRTTTLQYRAPEMLDVWARKHVGLPADIWALGIFLYKLCYYTTPFEPHGVMAIQNVNYSFPRYPAYSEAIKDLIASMLRGDANKRPDIEAVHRHVCRLRGISPKITKPQRSEEASAPALPRRPKGNLMSPTSNDSEAVKSAVHSPVKSPEPTPKGPSLADAIAPMRRGRPTSHRATPSASAAPTLSNIAAGFDDAFKPTSEKPSASAPTALGRPPPLTKSLSAQSQTKPKTEFHAFESQFPALDDAYSISGDAAASPTVAAPASPVSGSPTAPQIQRHASGFKDLLAPTPQSSSPRPSHSPSRSPVPDSGSSPIQSPSSASSALRINTSIPPVKPPKPQLVSTASQTSPELMERWFLERIKVLDAARRHEQMTASQALRRQPSNSSSSSGRRAPQKLVSIGEDSTTKTDAPSIVLSDQMQKTDLLADSPPPIASSAPRLSASTAIQDVQDALPGLRANYMRNGSMSLDSDTTSSSAASQSDSVQSEDLSEAMKRFQPLPDMESFSSANFSSMKDNLDGSNGLDRAATESTDSSDGEGEPEDLDAVRPRPRRHSSGPLTPQAKVSPQSHSASLPYSARSRPSPSAKSQVAAKSSSTPEIIAPIPQKPRAAITNLVSRYETMGSTPAPEGGASKLKKRPMSLYGTSSSRGPSGSPAMEKAAPFKPSKPSPGPKPVPTGPKPGTNQPTSVPKEDEAEEQFVGVAKMKERWQNRGA